MKTHVIIALVVNIASAFDLLAVSQIQITATVSGSHGTIRLPVLTSIPGEKITPNTTTTKNIKLSDGRIIPIRFSLMCSAENSDRTIKYFGTLIIKDVISSKNSNKSSLISFATSEHVFSGETSSKKEVHLKLPDHSVLKLSFSETSAEKNEGL